MTPPTLDPRSKSDVMERIAQRAAAYTPEWRYEPGSEDDPGAALAELFGDMLYQTVDRLNSLPEKTYVEFLQLLGVKAPSLTPASGYMQFNVHPGQDRPVAVPQGTQLLYRDEDGQSLVYETVRRLEATPAQLEHVFYCDARQGLIQELDMAREQRFFAPVDGENLQKHRFTIAQNQVLALQGPFRLRVRFCRDAQFLEEDLARQLADPDFARWSYTAGGVQVPFDAAEAQGGVLLLEKRGPAPLEPDEAGRLCITCDMGQQGGSLLVDGVELESQPLEDLRADAMVNNDVPIPFDQGGYCFGRRPTAYETFYLRSDTAFSKSGATARVRLDLKILAWSQVDAEPQYEFTHRIIDKQDAVTVVPDDVYVQQVVWEYYNGSGWADLEVSGDRNPFDGKSDGPLELRFRVPADAAPASVMARTGWYIRARVVHVENFMSANQRWLLPFIKDALCTWQYEAGQPAEYLCTQNNGCTRTLEKAARVADGGLEVYTGLPDHPRSMYLCFGASPDAMPLSMLFEIRGKSLPGSKVGFEAWNGKRFETLRSVDQTRNLTHTGAAFLYIAQPLPRAEFFGVQGCWLRLSRSAPDETDATAPWVGELRLNCVLARQTQQAEPQNFSAQVYDAGKQLQLMYYPVLDCNLWVDERSEISMAEVRRFQQTQPDRIRAQWDGGALTGCQILWQSTSALTLAGPEDRVYMLEPLTGRITFGDGRRGKVPPQGDRNIQVEYSYGGGSAGNVPEGTVTNFLGSVPGISTLRNLTPMSGGTDEMPPEKLQALGNRRIRHRGRAVGSSDFEDLTLENFPQALAVKCFSGLDEQGADAPGHVTLVVMCADEGGERAAEDLCRSVYDFLAPRADCTMTAAGRLHVRPSTVVTVNAGVTVTLADLDQAAATQQRVADAIGALVRDVWRGREIGQQIRLGEIYRAVKAVDNVTAIRQVFLEGVFSQDGRQRVVPIEDDAALAYATVKNGTHIIKIT